MVPLTLKLPAATVDALEQFSEGSTRSATARTFLEFGLQQLTQPGASEALEAHQLLGEFRRLVDRWPGGCTPSGAIWSGHPAQMPDEPPPVSVVSTPAAVLLHGLGGSLVLEREQLQLVVAADDVIERQLQLPQLLALGGELASSLTALATRPARAELTCGLMVERTAEGPLRFGLAGKSIVVDALTGWRFAAEVLAFATAQLSQEAEVRADLNRRISEVSSWG